MPRKKTPANTDPDYVWSFRSSKAHAGVVTQYVTQLNKDKSVTCNCPGWIFSRGTKDEKACKHTRMIQEEKIKILSMLKSGEPLPLLLEGDVETGFTEGQRNLSGKAPAESKIRFGRVIEI